MRRAKGVVFALATLGKARQAARLAQGADAVAPPGQDLVRIGLMPHIPDHLVSRGFEHIMQRHGQFDHAQTRTQMPARLPDSMDHFGANIVGQAAQFRQRQAAHIGGKLHPIKDRCRKFGTHDRCLTRLWPVCRLTLKGGPSVFSWIYALWVGEGEHKAME
jgi:hypothetical protein